MYSIKRIGISLAVFLPQLVFAATTTAVPDARALREECSAFSQAGMRDCLAKKESESQESLRRAEENAVTVLSRWDEDENYIRSAKAALAESEKEFEKYRNVQCQFSASLSGGSAGNAHELGQLACIAELNNRRAAQLRSAVSDLPLK
jgi:uncharacterized protein YecT (DUF1311 family)